MKLTLKGLVLFASLAAASAVVAQTIEGVNLDAIRAAADGQKTDAQTLLDAVAHRGDAHVKEAEELREAGARAVAGIDPATLPKGAEGPIDFDEMLAGAAANSKVPMGEGPLFIAFASLSMPEASLRALIRDTSRAGGVVLFRGFPGNSTHAFAEGLKKVVSNEEEEAHLGIDPRLFRAFGVTQVPTFVAVSRDYALCEGLNCTSVVPDHDRMIGNVSVDYALESFATGHGPGAGIATVALANLRKAP